MKMTSMSQVQKPGRDRPVLRLEEAGMELCACQSFTVLPGPADIQVFQKPL